MASTSSFRKFDTADHVGNVYVAFVEFVGSIDYEYEGAGRVAPAGTVDNPAWLDVICRKTLRQRRLQWIVPQSHLRKLLEN